MSEKQFENKVKRFLKECGCWVLKTWSNGVQRSGIPDLLICCNGYFLGVELKAQTGKPSRLQIYNIDEIQKSGGIAFVLYPNQFEDFKQFICELKGVSNGSKSINSWRQRNGEECKSQELRPQ